MSHLNDESIKKLTELCRIECTEKERHSLLKDLESILTYFDELAEIDTENVPACNHVLKNMANVMREDVVGNIMPRETFLSNAAEHTGGMIKVPPVIAKNPNKDQ